MYERRYEPLLSRRLFLLRLARHALIASGVIAAALLVGVLGYHLLAGLGWIDSLLNAAMILGGMGPVDTLRSNAAKVFASLYALFSGVVFLGAVGVLIAPLFHRLLHHFHLEEADEPDPAGDSSLRTAGDRDTD